MYVRPQHIFCKQIEVIAWQRKDQSLVLWLKCYLIPGQNGHPEHKVETQYASYKMYLGTSSFGIYFSNKKNCFCKARQWVQINYGIRSTKKVNLQCGNAPLLTIFARQETRKVLHLVNSSSIFLNLSTLKKDSQKEITWCWL